MHTQDAGMIRTAPLREHLLTIRFAVGQVWTDLRGRTHQTIVAITNHADAPIITQDDSGDACAYRADGSFPISNSRDYDLVTLISDAEVDHSTEAF